MHMGKRDRMASILQIYWIDSGAKKIFSASVNGGQQSMVLRFVRSHALALHPCKG